MEQIAQYFTDNYMVILPFAVLILEFFLRKIPTFSNLSLFYHFTKILDIFAPNLTLKKDARGLKKSAKFITRYYKLEKE